MGQEQSQVHQPQVPQLPSWVGDLCQQYKAIDVIETPRRVVDVIKLLKDNSERNDTSAVPLLATTLRVLELAQHAVANKHESLRLADRVARINFLILEAMIVKESKRKTLATVIAELQAAGDDDKTIAVAAGYATTSQPKASVDALVRGTCKDAALKFQRLEVRTASQVQKCIDAVEEALSKAATLLEAFQSGGTDLGSANTLKRFKITHEMYFPDRVGAFVDTHANLGAILKTATPIFSLEDANVKQCAAPSTEDIRNSTCHELDRYIRDVQPFQLQMDRDMQEALYKLKTFKADLTEGTLTMRDVVIGFATGVLESTAVLPWPFNVPSLVTQISALAENAVVNKTLCAQLAARVKRVALIVVQLENNNDPSDARRQCAKDLAKLLQDAVELLETFRRWQDVSWTELNLAECGQVICYTLSAGTSTKFTEIREGLDSLTAETHLACYLEAQDRAVMLRDILTRDEIVHVLDKIQSLKPEQRASMDTVRTQLEATLKRLAEVTLEPCDVIVDETKTLGGGAAGTVVYGGKYRQAEVAVKVVKLVNEDDLQKVEAEVHRTMLARHPNVVRVFGIVMLRDREVGVVMERLYGSLANAQVKKSSRRMKYTLDIIAGMAHMHGLEHPVVHFDLRPSHILLTQDGHSAKIIDFGVSQAASGLGSNDDGATFGSLQFMAPELFIQGGPRPSLACDVYSFAVVLAELWTGTTAWQDTERRGIGECVVAGRRPFSLDVMKGQGVPAPIIALIGKCWAQVPQNRPTFADLQTLHKISSFDQAEEEWWPEFLQPKKVATSAAPPPRFSE
jgi:serine/threonine protein kinase